MNDERPTVTVWVNGVPTTAHVETQQHYAILQRPLWLRIWNVLRLKGWLPREERVPTGTTRSIVFDNPPPAGAVIVYEAQTGPNGAL